MLGAADLDLLPPTVATTVSLRLVAAGAVAELALPPAEALREALVEVTEQSRGAPVALYRVTVLPDRPLPGTGGAVDEGAGPPARVPAAELAEDSRVTILIIGSASVIGAALLLLGYCHRRRCKVGASPPAEDFKDVEKP